MVDIQEIEFLNGIIKWICCISKHVEYKTTPESRTRGEQDRNTNPPGLVSRLEGLHRGDGPCPSDKVVGSMARPLGKAPERLTLAPMANTIKKAYEPRRRMPPIKKAYEPRRRSLDRHPVLSWRSWTQ